MMKLGLFAEAGGHHIAAWRHPDAVAGASQSFAHYADMARLAERGCFDMLFLADTVATFGPDDVDVWKRGVQASRLEPITLLAALSSITEHIGLVSTFSTSFIEPFYVARFFASLDRISGGRAGWNLVTSASPSEPLNFSRTTHPPPAERYARAEEFADVVLGLWNTWEADAFVEDRGRGLFFDQDKMHLLRHAGERFAVRGPLTVRPSPQGRPIVVQAGQSETGRALAARTADIVFTVQQDIGAARAFRLDMHERLINNGRAPTALKIMPGVVPFVAATAAEARAEFDALQALIHPDLGLRVLGDLLGVDLSTYPLDGPLPEPPPSVGQAGRQKVVLDMARRERLSIRDVYRRVAGARGHRIVFGAPTDIADDLEEWFTTGAADGFNIMPPIIPQGLRRFVDLVTPELQRRGLFRTAYEGATLRDNLGLPFPTRGPP